MAVIEVANLRKRYADHVAVDDVSFSVERGEIFGILGPNGAGKTTTVECVEGLRKPDGGRISVLGFDPHTDGLELRRRVGVQLQKSELPEKMRVSEAMDLYASFYANPADGDKLLDDLGLTAKRHTPYKKLSGGQQQRLAIALALVGNPEIAFLDELTTGLDPQARRDTWQLIEQIRDRGVTVVLVTHFMEEAERLCDRLALVDAGRVVAIDSPAGLVSRVDGGGLRLRFRPSVEFDAGILTALPEVTSVAHTASQVVVSGNGNLLHVVSTTLAAHNVVPLDLRVEQTNLEDAFVALTGRRLITEEA
ncbi:multidrug ABC transporter ATP-binding protein [Actinosynnema sp. ALI-1.44]|uniref:ABC transporter ATP-binding protein n=1 Tax=Actinosynnema sp. ALI-1.44 TaxID=1933779 RepID=UPI00097CA4DE|nr:ABC transporter ATP-binding protein [Actinosynnema sp. ALI-1.44]ONI81112.1 multidrug ABC transporter ATP-binding protein [Actinosynnema sp. ALI-1.44]